MGGRGRWVWAFLVALLVVGLSVPHVGAETRSVPAKAKNGLVEVPGIPRVRAVAVGLRQLAALDASGNLYTVGIAIDEPGVHFAEVKRVEVPFRPVAVTAGYHHYAALDADGAVWVGGLDLCNPCSASRLEQPAAVAVSAGPDYVASLAADGTVKVSDFGMSRAPMAVEGLEKVTAISAGPTHLLAIRADGTAWHVPILRGQAGGPGTARQLKGVQGATGGAAAEGFSVLRLAGGQIVGITVNEEGVRITAPGGGNGSGTTVLAGHTDHFLVLSPGGSAWWGQCCTSDGRTVGAGQVSEIILRTAAAGPYVVAGIAADGKLYAWRAPTAGAQLAGWEQVRSISAGDGFLLGVRADGKAQVSRIAIDELGMPDRILRVESPREVGSGMASGRRIALLATDGTVWHGQVAERGDGPVAVKQAGELPQSRQIALTGDHLFALGADGLVRYTNLGGSASRTFVFPHVLETRRMAAGPAGLIVVTADGAVWTAPITADGPQELKRVEGHPAPRAVTAGADFQAILPGGNILSSAVSGRIWGDPHVDQHIWGDPHVDERDGSKVWGDPHVSESDGIVAAGNGYLATGVFGTVWKLKAVEVNGQKRLQAAQVGGLAGVSDLASDGRFHAALRADGTVWVWRAE